jgi:hypothetical protein
VIRFAIIITVPKYWNRTKKEGNKMGIITNPMRRKSQIFFDVKMDVIIFPLKKE